jgi:hypothetical protein
VGSKEKDLVKEQLGGKTKICPCFFLKSFPEISEIRGRGDIQIQDNKGMCVCMGGRMSQIISDVLMTLFSFSDVVMTNTDSIG